MRVLEVMEATIGGTRRHLVDLAGGLLDAGDELHLCVAALREPRFCGDLDRLAARGAVVHELPMRRSIAPISDLGHVRELTRIVRRVEPNIVHTHSSKAGVIGRLAASRAGCRTTVHTPHTFAFLFDAMFSLPKRVLFRAIEARLARGTTRVIAVSDGEAATMVRSGVVSSERIVVVPNGVEPGMWEAAAAADRTALGLSPEAPVVLVAGLLNAAKGQDLAIRSLVAGELAQHADVQLVLAGHGEQLASLEALAAELGVRERVHFLGWREDLPELMAMADLVLLPSRWEGMPYVVLEAMAAAKAVVATRVDGACDLVVPGETGALVEVGEPAAIAGALADLLGRGPAGLAELGAAGSARVRSKYTTEHMVAATRRVFQEALQATGVESLGRPA